MKTFMAALAASVAATALVGVAHADTFVNGSFETGTLQGWTTGGGFWSAGPYPVPQSYLPGGSAYDASVQNNSITSAGFDGFTDNNLRLVYAGNHSAQVNNSISDYSVSVLSQRVNNYSDPIIAFAYAAVLQDSHGPTDSDAFIITLTDATTNEVLYSFNLNSATAPGTFTQSSQNWYYTDWLTQSIDVSGRSGHDFILSLLANDCPYGGHAGYAYLDGFGSVVGGGGTGTTPTGTFQYWDGSATGNGANGIVDGGDGVWDATTTNWTEATGAANGAYTPNPGSVVFTGTPGTVTVDDSKGAVAINGMQFAVDGYHIVGDPIALGGTVATIQVGDGTAAGADIVAIIDAPLTGSGGLTKTDLGTLILGGVNSYTGTTTVTDGTLIGSATSFGTGAINNNADLVIDQAADASFANRIMGAGNLFKTGAGRLQLTGTSPFAGRTLVGQGTLQVDGSLGNSAVTVGNGATLAGRGTVGSVSALAGSTMAPGGAPIGTTSAPGGPVTLAAAADAIGTLSVNGAFAQMAGSTYQVDLTTAGASDKIVATGNATVEAGSKIVVTKLDAARYQLGKRYTVLTAADGVAGEYSVSGDTHVSLFYDLIADYDSTHVYLDVAQTHAFASVAATPNQKAAARGADSVAGPLHDAIGYLDSVRDARLAFDSLSGEIHATARAAAFEDSRFIREAVNDRLLASGEPNALWFRGFGSWGHMKGDGNAARYERDIGGFFLGYDFIHSGALRIGALVGYDHSRLKLPARASSATADDAHVGVYAGVTSGALAVRLGGSYTFRSLKTNRSVSFPGFSDDLRAKYQLGIGQVFGEVGYKIPVMKSATIEPYASVAYVHLDSDHAFERGGPSRLEVEAQDSHMAFTTLGARFNAALSSSGGTAFSLKGSAGWRYAASNRTSRASLAFIGGDGFSVAAPPIAKNVVAADLGADARLRSGLTLSLSYSGQIGDRLSDHGVKAGLRMPF